MEPLVVVIAGIGPCRGLAALLPALEQATLYLPGYLGFTLPDYRPATMADSLDTQLEARFPGRAVTIVGVSLGGSVALAMRSKLVRSVVALDPPLTPSKAWPLRSQIPRMVTTRPELALFFAGAMADYPIRTPAEVHAVVGSAPLLPPRAMSFMPSLCTEEDRSALRERGARIYEADAGHAVVDSDPETVRLAIDQAVALTIRM